jgi:small ubiquitin-related modifier
LKVLAGYRQFLDWKVTFVDLDAKKLSPSISINKMWHQHILDNRNYAEDCQLLFGKIIYHDPDGELDMEAHRKRIANTKDALHRQYGKDYDREVWNFGSHDDEGTTRGTKRARSLESTGSRTVSPAVDQSVEQPPRSNETITIHFCGDVVHDAYFKVKKTTQMERIFKAFAHHNGVSCSTLRFHHNGKRIDPNATPQMLELRDMDQIDVSPITEKSSQVPVQGGSDAPPTEKPTDITIRTPSKVTGRCTMATYSKTTNGSPISVDGQESQQNNSK